jgi:CHAD domain-containing protein
MSFRVRPGESIADGLRRLAKKELSSAREQLTGAKPPGEDAIHEARKSVKKVRAIVHLVKNDNGGRLSGIKKQLRETNRVLSQSRDADAMNEILAKLLDRQPRLLTEHTSARLRHQLSTHTDAVAQAATREEAWQEVAEELRAIKKTVKRWSQSHRGFRALAPGLRATHKSGRKAMARALASSRADAFHEWRKQIKALWYELRLIQDCSARIRKDVDALNRAETWLGDDHNISVLCAYLSGAQALTYDPDEIERFRRGSDRYQRTLRRQATASAKTIYAIRTRDYLGKVRNAWRNSHRRSEETRSGDRSRKRA